MVKKFRPAVPLEAVKPLTEVLQWALDKWKLNTRWPCPDCGRKGPEETLKTMHVYTEDGKEQFMGCHYCNCDELVNSMNRVLNTFKSTPILKCQEEGKQ